LPGWRKAAIGAALAGYAWVAGGLAPFTSRSLLSVLLPGAVLGAIAYGRPPERIPPPRRVEVAGFSYWAIGVAALFEWEASAFIGGPAWQHPSLTQLIDPLIAPHPRQERGHARLAARRLGAGAPVTTRLITAAGFAGLLGALAVLELLARRRGSRIPTAGQ
jgi:hypothetical protein